MHPTASAAARLPATSASLAPKLLVPQHDRQATDAPRAQESAADESAEQHVYRDRQHDSHYGERAAGANRPSSGGGQSTGRNTINHERKEKDHLRFYGIKRDNRT